MPSKPENRYPEVKPLLTKAQQKRLDSAFNAFLKKKAAFDQDVADAKKVVALTLAWVGVGERVVDLATTLLERRKSEVATGEDRTRLTRLKNRFSKLSELAELLESELPGVV